MRPLPCLLGAVFAGAARELYRAVRMPIVLVELPATDAADVNAPALVSACSAGLRRGTCVVAEPETGERAAAVAIVAWLDPEHLRARIDVGRRADERAGWLVRELTFHEQDSPLERWRSVGLAIAGVVGEATLLEPPAPTTAPAPAPKPPVSHAPVSRGKWRAALGPSLESGVSVGRPSAGVWLEAGRRCCGTVPLEITLTAANSWSVRETEHVATRFSSFGAGASADLQLSELLAVRGSLFALLEAVDASAADPATGAHASGARWLFGGLARGQLVWPASRPLSAVLGLEIIELSGATELRLFGRTAAISPAQRGGIQAGLNWEF
jgi:hypothetical protein